MNEESKFLLLMTVIITAAICVMVATVAVRDVLIAQIKCEAVK